MLLVVCLLLLTVKAAFKLFLANTHDMASEASGVEGGLIIHNVVRHCVFHYNVFFTTNVRQAKPKQAASELGEAARNDGRSVRAGRPTTAATSPAPARLLLLLLLLLLLETDDIVENALPLRVTLFRG